MPDAPLAILPTPSSGSAPTAPDAVLAAAGGEAALQVFRIQLGTFGTYTVPPQNQFYISWTGQTEIVIQMASLAAAGGPSLTASLVDLLAADEDIAAAFDVLADGTEIVMTAIAGDVAGFSFTGREDPANAVTVEDVTESSAGASAPAAVLGVSGAGAAPSSPASVLGAAAGGSAPSSPVVILAAASGGSAPSSPVVILGAASGGSAPTAPAAVLAAASGGSAPAAPVGVIAPAGGWPGTLMLDGADLTLDGADLVLEPS